MRTQTQARCQWVVKHATGFCPVGKNISRWNEDRSDKCPRCGAENESTTHVWQCQDPRAIAQWDKSLEALKSWMRKSDTDVQIRCAIVAGLRAWRDRRQPRLPRNAEMRQVVAAQVRIGWENALRGRLSLQWRECQRRYYERTKSKRSADGWIVVLISKLWDLGWSLWDHRNKILHESEESDTLKGMNEVDGKIRQQFQSQWQDLPARHQEIFHKGLENVLKESPDQRRAWLLSAESFWNRKRKRDEQGDGAAQRALMRRFFVRKPPTA